MNEAPQCRRCSSLAVVVTPSKDGTEQLTCTTCGRRWRRVTQVTAQVEADRAWWAD